MKTSEQVNELAAALKPEVGVPAVFPAMCVVQSALARAGVGKNATNQQQHFKYRAWDDVQQALAPLLAENHLLIIPRITGREESSLQTKSGGTLFRVVLTGDIEFISGMDGSRYSYPAKGEAMDSGDKATSKALTTLMKYGVLHGLCVPLEGVPDADDSTPEEAVLTAQNTFITDKQVSDLLALITETGADLGKFSQYLGVRSLEALPAASYHAAIEALERKRKQT